MVKNKWKRYNGYKYYFGANGNAVRGGQRINNVVYDFLMRKDVYLRINRIKL